MIIKNSVLLLNEKDIIEISNKLFKRYNVVVKKVTIKDDIILVEGIIKKIFALEFKINLSIEEVFKNIIIIKINDIKALKINLFFMLSSVGKSDFVKNRLGGGITVDGKKIYIDFNILKNCNIKNVKVLDGYLELEFDDIKVLSDKILTGF
ncbi:MAG: hypothetical protein ACRC57_07605 [Sarcina sp.]